MVTIRHGTAASSFARQTLTDKKRPIPSWIASSRSQAPQLPNYVSAAFGSLDQPWKPCCLRSAYGGICCHRFKPRNMTDDMFLA